MAMQSEFTRGYNSFSGVDIKATMGGKAIGSLQGISISVSREKAPIYTMGSPDIRAVARGKRGIAGSLIFIQFDMDPLMFEFGNPTDPTRQSKFLSDIDDIRPAYVLGGDQTVSVTSTGASTGAGSINAVGNNVSNQESDLTSVGSDQAAAVPWYPDQIPPFDVVLAAANEYGALAVMKILGIELMNGGYGVSVDDIVSEHSFTYLAHAYLPWLSQGRHTSMM